QRAIFGRIGRPVACRAACKEKAPLKRGALVTHSLLARRLISVTAINIDVGRAHIAAFHWAVPFIRLGRLCGICLRSNGIGLPTRARGEGRTTGIDRRGSAWIGLSAIGLTSRATVGSTGIAWSRGIGWRRVVGRRRAVGWRSWRAILCIRPRHPGGRSQNANSCDCDKSALHRSPPFAFAEINKASIKQCRRRGERSNRLRVSPSVQSPPLLRRKLFGGLVSQTRTPPEYGSPKGRSRGVLGNPHGGWVISVREFHGGKHLSAVDIPHGTSGTTSP